MNTRFRNQFLEHAVKCGLPWDIAVRVRRLASTHNRLAEAESNGDWPCDNGERRVAECARCGAGYVRAAMYSGRKNAPPICKSCRTEDLIRAAIVGQPVTVEFQGDPRGWTVRLERVSPC